MASSMSFAFLMLALVVVSSVSAGDLKLGGRKSNDRLVLEEDVEKDHSDLTEKIYLELDIDQSITFISAEDKWNNGASAEVTYGGVGKHYATINFDRPLWRGYKFHITVFARDSCECCYCNKENAAAKAHCYNATIV